MSERGSAVVEFVAAVGLLLLPTAMLVASIAPWVQRQAVARSVAREVARDAVVATTLDERRADDIAARMAGTAGLGPEALQVEIDGVPTRGGLVTATVTVDIPVTVIPGLVELGAVAWTVHHTEAVDLYRSLP